MHKLPLHPYASTAFAEVLLYGILEGEIIHGYCFL